MSTTSAQQARRSALDSALDVGRAPFPGAGSNGALQWVDRVLRGTGQVVFQANWLTGLLILVAIGINSPVYLVAAVVGVAASTATALLLRMEHGMVDAGLTGFNGCLFGIGLVAYLSRDFTAGSWPSALVWAYVVVGAAMTTVMLSAIGSLLGSRTTPALTSPFVFTAWIFLFATLRFSRLVPGPLLDPSLPTPLVHGDVYPLGTWFLGTFKGIAEIFFQDNWVSGLVILLAIAVNSRMSALMGLLGSVLGVGVAMLSGARATTIALGLFGFNAALTAMALGGVFFVLNRAGFCYTLFGVVVTVWAWATMSVLLSPVGMPTFTSAFVLVGWVFIIGKAGFRAVVPIDPGLSTYPEDNLRRWRADQLS
ncbi:urea transporter [Raineyella fluvialis]|uniref:Urea transporter n=1 Tax=Raineyella fluvialis TaxID=2662261 RepID=A0A5Q2FF68_9ACTN|nr:urea transporter [Raineyella fluvialis]QGF23355.1 urea transporter [Raineyella fluvialis]